jgi:electron transfer flavoprotein alpha subunit
MISPIIIAVDTVENRLSHPVEELIRFASRLFCGKSRPDVRIVLAGRDIADLSAAVSSRTGLPVIALEHENLLFPNPGLLAQGIIECTADITPRYICLHHSPRGCQTAAHIAHEIKGQCITGVESVAWRDACPIFSRAIFNGKLLMRVRAVTVPVVLTALPGQARAMNGVAAADGGRAERKRVRKAYGGFSPCGLTAAPESDHTLNDADVIVSAGMGIGKADNLDLIRRLAACFRNSAIGASRIVCDQGWLPHGRQIGETGQKVSPRLYMACGISGASQHMAGIKDAQSIIAINKDPRAAIFSFADYGVVEDLTRFLPLLLEKIGRNSD